MGATSAASPANPAIVPADPKTTDSTNASRINRNLIALKVVLFAVYGGFACLHSTLIPHMLALGLNYPESRRILIAVPFVALFGPLLVAPLVDRLAVRKQASSGRPLRLITAAVLLLAAIAYACLLTVPTVVRTEVRQPRVRFGCDEHGAFISQERCADTGDASCFHWPEPHTGRLSMTNCSYTCRKQLSQFEQLYTRTADDLQAPPEPASSTETLSREQNYADDADADYEEDSSAGGSERRRREAEAPNVEPPHLCERNADGLVTRCHAFTADRRSIDVHVTLRSALDTNETDGDALCTYPLDGFQCLVPKLEVDWMMLYLNAPDCRPMVECEVLDPYDEAASVLANSQCVKMIGDVDVTFWSYLLIRSVADLLLATAVTLLNTAIVIATRETSAGRGDVGRQLVFASLGWALCPLVLGLCGVHAELTVAVIVFAVGAVVAAVVLLLAKQMPLSPPEWWWHTKSGMLAIPMSAIRRYGWEIAAVAVVAGALGVFWSVIDAYQTWHLIGLDADSARGVLKYSLAVVALPSIALLWNSESFVEYCGHSNLLMTAFTVYILRYTGLALIDHPAWSLFMSAFEPVTLSVAWVTLVLYMRHLVPRRFSTCGQAIPVVAFFGLGRGLGAAIGLVKEDESLLEVQRLYSGMAVAACVLAVLYFVLYNCVLVPRCAGQLEPRESQADLPGANGSNGSYSPLRVYHNGRGRKGEFRY